MEKIGPADLQRSLKIEENAFLRLGWRVYNIVH